MTPTQFVLEVMRERAPLCGTYRSFAATARTFCSARSDTGPLALKTRDTVATETPALLATSLMVTMQVPLALETRRRGHSVTPCPQNCKRLQFFCNSVKSK